MSRALLTAGFTQGRAVPLRWLSTVTAVLLLVPLTMFAASTERAGRVLVTTGIIEAVGTDGVARNLERRTDVYSGETLRTAGKARAQVRFTDGALLSLRPDSELKIDDYHFENRDAVDHKYLRLVRGGFRTVTGRIGRVNRASYRVSTPLAVIGVRGTDWEALQIVNGPLLLGVNEGGITAQSTKTNATADIGTGASFNFAQITPDGAIQLLPEAPDALVKVQAVEKGEKPPPEKGEGGKADGEKSAGGDEKNSDLATNASEAPPPPAGGGDTGTGTAPGPSTDPAAAPPPPPSVNPAELGMGTPPTTVPISRVLTDDEVNAIVADTHLALVAGMSFSANGVPSSVVSLVGPSVTDATPSFNFALVNSTALPGTDRRAGVNGATHFVQRGAVALSGRQDNVGGVAGLTFGRYDGSATLPLPVFVDANNSANNFNLTSPFVFALFNPSDIASLSGRFVYAPTANLISVSSGTVSTVLGELVLNVNLGSGQIERGVLDIGFGTTPDAFVFAADLQGNISNVGGRGVLNATVRNIVLQDNVARQTLSARGTVSGAFTGAAAITNLVLSFDYADTAGRNQFARGVVLFGGQPAPPLPSLALSTSELTQLQSGFFFVGTDAEVNGGIAGGPATDARLSLGSPLFSGNTVTPNTSNFVTPADPRFSTLPPDDVVRQTDAPTVGFRQSFTVAGTQSLSWGQWAANSGAPVVVLDSATGTQTFQSFTVPIFWATALPKSLASLTGTTTFSSTTGVDFQGVFGSGNGPRPTLLPILGVSSSFAVDFGTGQISGGHLFAVTERNAGNDLGFDFDFVGNVVSSGGKAFALINATKGAYRGNVPLDVFGTKLTGFFTGTGPQTSFVASFFSQSLPLTGNPDFVSGTLAIGQIADPTLAAADVSTGLDRVALAVFNPVDSQGAIITSLLHNIGPGLTLGRGGPVNAASPATFGIFASNLTSVARADFFALPAGFAVRQSTAAASRVSDTIGGPGAFAVGWGEWLADPRVGNSASAQSTDTLSNYNTDVLFASIAPTPRVLTGTATYSGTVGGTPGLDLLARGGALGAPSQIFDKGSAVVNVDFNTGLVSGDVQVGSTQLSTDWNAGFSGRLSRNIAELTLSTLQVTTSIGGTQPGSIGASSITGVVSGASGEQFVSGFQFVGPGQHVEGLMRAGKQ